MQLQVVVSSTLPKICKRRCPAAHWSSQPTVPRGCLSPLAFPKAPSWALLFIIHYSNIPSATKASTALFVDDVLLYRSNRRGADRTPCCAISKDLHDLECWTVSSNTKMNAAKSVELVLGPRPSATETFLNGERLQRVLSQVHLGITISSLRWKAILALSSKVSLAKWHCARF